MSRTKSMLALAAGTALVGTAAQASVLPFDSNPGAPGLQLTPVAIPSVGANPVVQAGAGVDDPSLLSQYDVFDLQVVVSSATGQDRWASADLRALLGLGTFFIPPAGDGNYLAAPATRNATGSRYLQADTMVMSPIANATRGGILGKSTFAPASQSGQVFPSNGSNFLDGNDTNGTAFEPANNMMLVDVAWGDPMAGLQPAGSNGTFTIARLTITKGAQGTFIGRIGSTLAPSQPVTFTYILGVIPEPTSVALLGLGLGAVALRRRK